MHFLCSRLVRDVTNLSKWAGIASFAFSGRFSTSKRNGSITTMCQKNFPLFSLPGGQGGVEEQGSPHPRSFCAVIGPCYLWVLLPSRARGLFTPLSPSQLELPDKRPGVKPPHITGALVLLTHRRDSLWRFSLCTLWLQEEANSFWKAQ